MESFTSVYYACMKQFGCVILYCLVVSRVFTTVLDLGNILVVPYFITSQTTSIRQWKRLSLWGFTYILGHPGITVDCKSL